MSFTIKEASERLGCPAHKIRYYEKEGLLPYINRDQNGNRLFEEEHLEWMRVMSCFRATGMKVSVLKQMVNLAMEGASTIPLRKAMLTQYKKELHQRQNDLNQALEAVNQKLSIYDDMEKGKEDSENKLLQEMSSLKHI
ncbi:DNA-binding transcriptional MerR regulator [Paenibacillus sp. PvP094]|jgi:DNA-binding transcriptional MerR regulator|uniref:Putative DNA binding protein n=1 Tax=Paenibacillus illinoisensis TaxID=59845 RepID=A0A2W0CEN9_9BACL|nr:MerR family transcriptional regulator [Paenibacillus illinoisensis]PYY26288.1 putative DNA binding protein [Paenibacillus illinoisensis]